MQALVFAVGPERFALPLTQVREVIATQPVTSLPGSPGWLVGLTNLRGELVPVVDLTRLLDLPPSDTEPAHLVVVETDGGTAGVTADGAPRPADLNEPLGEGESAAALARYDIGDGEVATLIDLAAVVESVTA